MGKIIDILERFGIIASDAQAEDFEKWMVNFTWSKYNDDKMNQRIIIENKVKSLGLRFSNGTVGKEYSAQFIIPNELVDDVWIEGFEELGLSASLKEDNDKSNESNEKITTEEIKSCENDNTEADGTNDETVVATVVEDSTENSVLENENTTTFSNTSQTEDFILEVKGRPTTPGDFTVNLCYKHKGWLEGEPITVIKIPVAFNPDPRSLWKNIETPKDIIFYKPDYESEYLKVEGNETSGPRKDIVAASQRGRSHAQEGKPRDDHFKLYHCDESDWYIIAVADGAGSAKYSRKGSEIACETVVNYCKEQLLKCPEFEDKIRAYKNAEDEEDARKQMANIIYNIIGNAAFKAHKSIKDAAIANEFSIKDFATTLMFAICKKFDFGWFVASYWVGDGAMCIFNKDKQTFRLLGIPDEGEFSGQTRFLTMPEIFKDAKSVMDRLRFSIEEDFTALMLMTDGISDPMFETDKNLNSYNKWEEFWNKLHIGFSDDNIPGVELIDDNEEARFQLLRWMDFWSPGNHDDRTIAILY
jgi:serine/threonine protein phosphatase PrpC